MQKNSPGEAPSLALARRNRVTAKLARIECGEGLCTPENTERLKAQLAALDSQLAQARDDDTASPGNAG
jgi:hypothetical protein